MENCPRWWMLSFSINQNMSARRTSPICLGPTGAAIFEFQSDSDIASILGITELKVFSNGFRSSGYEENLGIPPPNITFPFTTPSAIPSSPINIVARSFADLVFSASGLKSALSAGSCFKILRVVANSLFQALTNISFSVMTITFHMMGGVSSCHPERSEGSHRRHVQRILQGYPIRLLSLR